MVWSAEDLASLSDGKKKNYFEKHMVTSGQNDVLIYFLSSHLVKYLFTLLEVTVGKKVSLNQYANYRRIQKSKFLIGVVFAFENF